MALVTVSTETHTDLISEAGPDMYNLSCTCGWSTSTAKAVGALFSSAKAFAEHLTKAGIVIDETDDRRFMQYRLGL